MIRKPNRYSKPRKAYELSRIKEENVLLEKYGLKNKKEIWKTIAKVNYFRRRAMALAKSANEEQEILFNKLRGFGLKVSTIADVLALTVEDLLQRRLPSVIQRKGLAKTVREGRQMVIHKRVLIDNKVINIPSYLVYVNEEGKIKLKKRKPKAPKQEISETKEAREIKEEQPKEAKEKAK
ncbi:30S ribosomal protein S4 [Candidatus Pacearchaeota archaeon]|nr:30S ribosomal protein S4 [Candidatus Pacearchaeota archaeon]